MLQKAIDDEAERPKEQKNIAFQGSTICAKPQRNQKTLLRRMGGGGEMAYKTKR